MPRVSVKCTNNELLARGTPPRASLFAYFSYNPRMKVVVVNEKDEVLGYKERDDRDTSDIIRVSAIWILNDKNEVLIAQRAFTKTLSPGLWGPSAAGTVEEGETYVQNIVKEITEEIGLTIREDELVEGKKYFIETRHRFFCQFYFARHNAGMSELTLERNELEGVRWISVPELIAWQREKPGDFTSACGQYLPDLEAFILRT